MSMSDVPQVQRIPIDNKIKYAIENNTYLDIPYRPYAIIYKIENIASYGLICEFNRVDILHTIYTYNKYRKRYAIYIDIRAFFRCAYTLNRPDIVKFIANKVGVEYSFMNFYPDTMQYVWFILDCIKDNVSVYNEGVTTLFRSCIYRPIKYEITKRIMSYCDTNIISRYELDINSICKKIAKLTEDQQNAQLRLYLMTLDLILDKWSIQIDELFQKDGVYMPLEFVKNHKIQIHMAHRGYMFAVDYQHKKALNIINMRKTYLKRYLDSRKRRITLWDTNISNIILSYT